MYDSTFWNCRSIAAIMNMDNGGQMEIRSDSSNMDDVTKASAAVIRKMAGGFAMTQVLHNAALLGIADRMASGANTVKSLAELLEVDASALGRFLRMMVVLDLLEQTDEHEFNLTELGRFLQSDHPHSIRSRILYIGAINYPVAAAAHHAIETGRPAFDHVFGCSYFEYLDRMPELGRYFNELMADNVADRISGILESYDFSCFNTIVDIGGGNAALLSAIMQEAVGARGIVFDKKNVLEDARKQLKNTDIAPRIELVAGDLFLGGYPTSADLYILSNIIHDWEDDRSRIILENCRAAMDESSVLILVEELLPTYVKESKSTVANDYSMLLLTGGQERTESQYDALLSSTGLVRVRSICVKLASTSSSRTGNWALMECKLK